jgi:hypothetical protein
VAAAAEQAENVYTDLILRHRVSALIVALFVLGGPVATLMCAATCESAANVNPHACCHHDNTPSGASLTCATNTCDHTTATIVTSAITVARTSVSTAVLVTTSAPAADSARARAVAVTTDAGRPVFHVLNSPLRI